MSDQRTFDDRDGSIWFDGRLVPWREANVHVLSHALHYASSVFEGQRAYGGEIFKLTEHSERLRKSGRLLDFEIPWSVAEIDAACRELLADSGLADAYMRPLAWRGSEQMGVSGQRTKIHLAIACWEWNNYFAEEAVRKGLRLDISPWRRPAPYTAPTESKASGLYMICTLARHAAQAKGYEDALMFDWRGRVAEGTGANAFFVKDGALHTPTPDCFLDGITRRTVIGLAKKRGLQVVDRVIMPDELGTFSECFLVGTAAEVTPVSEIGPHTYKPGKISETLINDYSAAVQPRKVAAE
jgi:branched-chain amino acid aminotransferase